MSAGKTLGLWASLLGLLACEVLAARTSFGSMAAPVLGAAMALMLSVTVMRLPRASPIAKVFAAAGVFWLAILMGLGSLDTATRHDIPVSTRTQP